MAERKRPQEIVIVGGGTAGWMAANLILTRWPEVNLRLLESKSIATVGVGEGSTPHLKHFFDEVGIAEADWMPRCNATYKNGIYFSHWSSIPGFKEYFHPFPAQVDDLMTMPLFFHNLKARLHGVNVNAHPDGYFLQSYLAENNLGPIAAENFPFSTGYGYHFDSGLLGQFLAEKAQARGLTRLEGELTEVIQEGDGHISAVRLSDDSLLHADFFIDCTGFRSRLLQGALKVPFVSYKGNLFNDAAVVLPSDIDPIITPATRSTALSNGWAWQIPLTNRYGNGYVYSRDYLSEEQAEIELRQHLGLESSPVEARHLTMKVGRVEKHWARNCLAVGLSQGFIEPLEATALALTYGTVSQFLASFNKGESVNAFNAKINGKFEGVRDYIVCHYKVNQRRDTDYWRDNARNKNLSENLQRILYAWHNSETFAEDLYQQKLMGSYQPKSWACLLAGYGIFPPLPEPGKINDKARADSLEVAEFIRRCGLNFKTHNELLVRSP